MDNVAETARKALEILDRDGWCKGSVSLGYEKDDYRKGSHCLGGAWIMARWGQPFLPAEVRDQEEFAEIAKIIGEQYPELAISILHPGVLTAHFNDLSETTEPDVRAILEKLAAKEGT